MVGELEDATRAYAKYAEEEAHAAVDFKSSWSTALLGAEGKTDSERKAKADLSTLNVYRNRKVAEARSMASLERMRSVRAQLSALQTLSKYVGEQT